MVVTSAKLLNDVLTGASDVLMGIIVYPTGWILLRSFNNRRVVRLRQYSINIQPIRERIIFIKHVLLTRHGDSAQMTTNMTIYVETFQTQSNMQLIGQKQMT